MFIKLLIFTAFTGFSALFSFGAYAGSPAQSAVSRTAIKNTTPELSKDLTTKGFALGDPVFLRIIKSPAPAPGALKGGTLEVYLQKPDGQYELYKTYDVCAASGTQGPKTKTGDQQSPEGFYYLNAARFNPWSSYHLSLNLGYPNTYDRAHGYTGDYLMIHGNCVSIGCYAMTDAGIDEIYTLAQAAMLNGQAIIRVHSFPFPMSEANLAASKGSPHYEFWLNLKQGWDWFEDGGAPPNVTVKDKTYVFGTLQMP